MSEKIYAYLLRLFPSAFRRHYEEEALQLLHDRLRDEKGLFRRLRLTFDLLADLIKALPQAHRNSYAETAPAASLTSHFDSVPSFQVLRSEPLRRGTIVYAGIFSLTAIAAFLYVMQLPAPYHLAARNGRISPIEAVLERLNQPITADSARESSYPSGSASADTGRPETTTGAADQPAQSAHHISAARHLSPKPVAAPEHFSSASVIPHAAPLQPEGIRVPARSPNPFNISTPSDAAADLSGEWTLRAAEGDAVFPRRFVFKQDSGELRGTGGLEFAGQYRITHGLVAGDSVQFELTDGRQTFLYDLRIIHNEIGGTLSIKGTTETRVITVWLQRIR